MWKFVMFLIVAAQFANLAQAKYGKYSDSNNNDSGIPKTKSTRGIGISAWGLVFLIICCIVLAIVAYYVTIFYPLLCKKERKYDRIELANI